MNKILNKLFDTTILNYTFLSILFLVSLSFISRFIFLDVRAIHHDESLHGYYSWLLSNGYGYIHNPLMHGPLNFHLNALSFLIFGDNFPAFLYSRPLFMDLESSRISFM